MQMYKVQFHSQQGQAVQSGTILVCAGNADAAEESVAAHLNLPRVSARFDTSRVKPSIYELERREFTLSDAIPMLDGDNKNCGSVHEITASAKVFAFSEATAIRRMATAMIDGASASKSKLPKHVNELSVDVEKAAERVRPSRIDEQSIYREKRFFSGGAARPR